MKIRALWPTADARSQLAAGRRDFTASPMTRSTNTHGLTDRANLSSLGSRASGHIVSLQKARAYVTTLIRR
jgi:hypothetical protein